MINIKSVICYCIGIICGAVVIGLGIMQLVSKDTFGIVIVIGGTSLVIISSGILWLETKIDRRKKNL